MGEIALSGAAIGEVLGELRAAIRCPNCKLNQFVRDTCRRCKKSLLPEPEPPTIAEDLAAEGPVTAFFGGELPIGFVVRAARMEKGWTQRQLAVKMGGVPRTYVSKVEQGRAVPILSSLARLANAFDLPISTLVRRAEILQSASRELLEEVGALKIVAQAEDMIEEGAPND